MPLTNEDKAWLTEQFDGIRAHLSTLEKRIDAVEKSFALSLEQLRRPDLLAGAVHSIDARIPALTKAVSDFGLSLTGIVARQWRDRDIAEDFNTRLTKLEEQVAKLLHPAA